jgi:hypothetical protein
MKKHIFAVFGVLLSAASLVACGAGGDATTLSGESSVLNSEEAPGTAAESVAADAPAAVSDSTQLAIDAKIEDVLAQYPDAVRIDDHTLSLADDQIVLELVPTGEVSGPTPDSGSEQDAEIGQVSQPLRISFGFNVYVRLTPNDRREVAAIAGAVGGGAAGAVLCAEGTPILQTICSVAGVEIGSRVARAVFDRVAQRRECGLEIRVGFSSGTRFISGDSSRAC